MRKVLVFISLLFVLGACKKDKSSPAAPDPAKAVLVAPAKNEACTQVQVISDTESKVTLKWNNADNTDTYEVFVKNLLTSSTTNHTTTNTTLDVNLQRNTPYSWYVVSKSNKVSATAQSEVWKFFNPGSGLTSFAPYPAEIVSPVLAQSVTASNGKVNLSWTGSDPDNDIAGYDIYFGTSATNPGLLSSITASVLNDVTVTSNTTYYWKVVTKDSKGNTSDSGIFHFKVN